jgi:hypothetical protein
MYVGGMGSATHNYHREAMARVASRGGGAHPRALAGGQEAGGHRGSARRVHRTRASDGVTRPHPFALAEVTSIDGPTGWIVRCDTLEELELAADLGGTRDEVKV